jgi:hypothetical protein
MQRAKWFIAGLFCVSLAAGAALYGNYGGGFSIYDPVNNNTAMVNSSGALSVTLSGASPTTVIASSAAESSHVLKSSAGNLYSIITTIGTTTGYVMLFNATSAPADGAVTPLACWAAPTASATVGTSYSSTPLPFSTGMTVVFSSTGCFTKTASATAYFSAQVQ